MKGKYFANDIFSQLLQLVNNEIGNLVSNQHDLENKYENVLSKKEGLQGPGTSMADQRLQADKEAKSTLGDLRQSTNMFARGLKQSPLTADNLEKVQADR